MDFKNVKNILVVGLGKRTGLAASNFLAGLERSVTVTDVKPADELKSIIRELDKRVTVLAGDQSPIILDRGFDLIVLSPGVPQNIELIKEARRRNIQVIAEIELAYNFIKGKIIAITGTDGKSTTTSLVGHILNSIGVTALVGGNIGIPLISLVGKTCEDTVSVVELSSFQLETIEKFRPDVAAVMNVSPDHLDRYNGMEDYLAAKLRISLNQNSEDYYIYRSDDKLLSSHLNGIRAGKLRFSYSDRTADSCHENGNIYIKVNDRFERVVDASRMLIMGVHNVENTMAALLMVRSVLEKMKLTPDFKKIEAGCYSFKGLPHRMEKIGDFNGRHFINDSKATTVGAVEMALRSLKESGVLILGGKTKGDDYSRLAASMNDRVRHLVLIGESTVEFKKIFRNFPMTLSGSMDEAVAAAMKASREGDVIILSPACASFDMFSNFEERGDVFREAVEKLKRGELRWS
ncbi:MAG: UDP-N-acetylmuramoyl-L-alanine--D-glutamate ligase [Spirochaetes bacterium]|nr:UDP-N-acetylmuramoyl-L-alanine--D-glutamate ligase [Spirochaetota bacterium]